MNCVAWNIPNIKADCIQCIILWMLSVNVRLFYLRVCGFRSTIDYCRHYWSYRFEKYKIGCISGFCSFWIKAWQLIINSLFCWFQKLIANSSNCSGLTNWKKKSKELCLPGFEPGTLCVWGIRDNHYTTDTSG